MFMNDPSFNNVYLGTLLKIVFKIILLLKSTERSKEEFEIGYRLFIRPKHEAQVALIASVDDFCHDQNRVLSLS